MKKITQILTTSSLIFGIILLCIKSSYFIAGLFFVPFSLFPLILSLLLLQKTEERKSIIILLIGTILYTCWFLYAYLSIFYWYPDPQGAIALLFTGVYSLPVMGIIWGFSVKLNKQINENKTNRTIRST